MRISWVLLSASIVLYTGCGGAESTWNTATLSESSVVASRASAPMAEMASSKSAMPVDAELDGVGMMGGKGGIEGQAFQASAGASDPAALAIPRKLIYTADLGLVVEDFAEVEGRVAGLVSKHRGYIAEMRLSGSPGRNRTASWKIRVPIENFEGFMAEAGSLGELERQQRGSADVSEEFYDLEARIRNKKVEEQRLIKILEENNGKLEEVLRIEAELSRVRGEVERMEGRIRVLENLTALTTVTLEIRERVKFEPETPVAASFPTRVSRTFNDSLNALVALGQRFVLWAVAFSVWLPLFLIGAIVGWVIGHWAMRRLFRALTWIWENRRRPIGPGRPSTPPSD